MSTAHHRYINSRRTQWTAVLLGTFFIFFYVVMPGTLGNAAESRGLDDQQLGLMASSFMLGVFLASGSGIYWLRRFAWRRVLRACAATAAAGFLGPVLVPGYLPLLGCMFLCGLSCGAAYAISIACLGDGEVPERGFGLTWGVQTALGVVVSFALPRLVRGPAALDVTLLMFAGLVVLAALLIPWMPDKGLKTGSEPAGDDHPTNLRWHRPVVFAGFGVIVLVFLAESGIWAYMDRIAVAGGMTREFAGTAIAASLLAAAGSSFLAAAIGKRWGRLLPMSLAIGASILSAGLFYIARDPASFLIAAVVYGAAWNFGGPFRMALIAEADVSGRYVAAITAMQTLGSVIGPSLAGLLALGGSYGPIYMLAIAAWTLAWILFWWADRRFRRVDANEGQAAAGR